MAVFKTSEIVNGMDSRIRILLHYLGVDTSKVKSATIYIKPDSMVIVELEQYAYINEKITGDLETKKFKLVPIEE